MAEMCTRLLSLSLAAFKIDIYVVKPRIFNEISRSHKTVMWYICPTQWYTQTLTALLS